MPVSQDVSAIAQTTIPSLASQWQTWAQKQIDAVKAQAAADQDAAVKAAIAQTQAAQAQTVQAAVAEALSQVQQDHADEVAALHAAIASAAPPAA
ncbi:MAG TPA: hypothetical protein VMU59_09235 [Caulobacteraceae bacterium]|nr:hypothetical protein [Caulobacteraceae bacterium]